MSVDGEAETWAPTRLAVRTAMTRVSNQEYELVAFEKASKNQAQ